MDNYYENKKSSSAKIWGIVCISVMVLLAAGVITFVALSNYFTAGDPVRNIYNITYEGDSDSMGGELVADMMGANVIEVHAEGSAGSGFIITMADDGSPIALTNYHVIESSPSLIGTRTVYETGPYALGCTLLGYDAHHDVAVIKLPSRYREYTFLDLLKDPETEGSTLDSWFSDPVLGEKMYAIGNSRGDGLGMYDGICTKQSTALSIHQKNGSLDKIVPVFQTTAAINSGMSGGPVFNKYGQILGIGTYKTAGYVLDDNSVDDPDDMNYAVPVNIALEIYNAVIASGTTGRQVSLISAADTSSTQYGMSITAISGGYQFNAFGNSGRSGVTHHGALGFAGEMLTGVGIRNGGLKVTSSKVNGLSNGDVITKIDGKPVGDYGKMLSVIYSLNVASGGETAPIDITIKDGDDAEKTILWRGQISSTDYRVIN